MPTPLLQPEILAHRAEQDDAQFELRIGPDLEYFRGHFAGFPILPGVVQLDWAVGFGRRQFAIEGEFTALDNLKFQAPIIPPSDLHLRLHWDAARGRLEFSYSDATRKYSSGRVLFGAAA